MIPGFNHTVMHHGTAYHVQTEDSGLQNPVISTHLFLGGNVLASRRTSYAEVVGSTDAESRVRKLMQDQHKEMLRQLIRGAFDREGAAAAASAYQPGELRRTAPAAPAAPPSAQPASAPAMPPRAASRAPAPPQPRASPPTAPAPPPRAAAAAAEDPPVLSRVPRPQPGPVLIPEIDDEDLLSDRRLDEVILAYLAEAPGTKRGQ